jgi:DNA polymerase sigma
MEVEGIIRMIYKEQCVTKEDLALRDKVITNIKNAFKNCSDREYPQILTGEVKISGFGSCNNGLWNVDRSDIDITCIIHDKLAYNQLQLLKSCAKLVKNVAKQGTLVLVPASRIPILKFTEKETGLEIDFNVNNVLAMHNTDLIYTYCQLDQRFHILGIFLKHWAKKVDIIGAAYGYLSSYALTLMLISFLQSRSPPVLPCLQEKKLRDRQHKRTSYYPVSFDLLESKRRRNGGGGAKSKDPTR